MPANGQELPGLQDTGKRNLNRRATQGSIKRSSAILSRPAQLGPPQSPRQHHSCPQHRSQHHTMVRTGRFPQKTFSTALSSPRPGQVLRQPTGTRRSLGYGRSRPTSSQRRPGREGAQPHLTSSSSSSQQRQLRGPRAGPAGTVLPSCPRTAAGCSRNGARGTGCGGFVCKERKMEKGRLTPTARREGPRAVSGTVPRGRAGRAAPSPPAAGSGAAPGTTSHRTAPRPPPAATRAPGAQQSQLLRGHTDTKPHFGRSHMHFHPFSKPPTPTVKHGQSRNKPAERSGPCGESVSVALLVWVLLYQAR